MADTSDLKRTPLYDLHIKHGAKMVPFAGYEMPVQYKDGIMAEHLHTRQLAGLFDVSHMGQAEVRGEGAAKALETVLSADVRGLERGEQKYALLLNDEGGIKDDLMVSRPDEEGFMLVVNAACKETDFPYIESHLSGEVVLERWEDRALLALQGPKAVDVLEELAPGIDNMVFMEARSMMIAGIDTTVSRSGYTGEDGFEISVANDKAVELAEAILSNEYVKLIGLGARDSLRLEAGLCLYGHDMDESTTPIEASLAWALPKWRRKMGDFPGADKILDQIENGAPRKRVGIKLLDRAPAREGADIATKDGAVIGTVTSGGFAPSLEHPIAMGYVETGRVKIGTEVDILVRGKARAAKIVKMPFVAHRFYRGK